MRILLIVVATMVMLLASTLVLLKFDPLVISWAFGFAVGLAIGGAFAK